MKTITSRRRAPGKPLLSSGLALALTLPCLASAAPIWQPIPVPVPSPIDNRTLLIEILQELQDVQDRLQPERVTLSSGVFSLPANARSVDWVLINNDAAPQTVTVTVYRWRIGMGKVEVAPGPITVTIAPGHATHNANSVGTTFSWGGSFEVVVSGGSQKVLPTAMVWEDLGNTVIPGTHIGPGDWVRID
ncbi:MULTISPECIES: hypothetical protein [unclassified Luteimonas]